MRQRLSFDAWGNRRNPLTGKADTTVVKNLLFARGFTGHEHLDEVGLINMNGRVYDPALGMFISADNYVQQLDNTQNFNRYTYGFNNPMMYTDPSGNFAFWDDVVVGGLGFVVGYVGYGITTGNWSWKAVAAGGIGAGVALLGWNTMGAGTAALSASGGASATSFTGAASAVFGSASGGFGIQFTALTAMNISSHGGEITAADRKGWNGVWAMGGYMAASVLSTSLKPLSLGAKQAGLGLRQFAGVVLSDNLSDNMKDGDFDFHSVHIGPVGWDANRHDDTWGGMYSIFSKGLTGDQRLGMGFETILGLSLIKSDFYLPKYHRYRCGNGEWKFATNLHDANTWGNAVIQTSKIGTMARSILQGSDMYFQFRYNETTYQYWYNQHYNEDGTIKD